MNSRGCMCACTHLLSHVRSVQYVTESVQLCALVTTTQMCLNRFLSPTVVLYMPARKQKPFNSVHHVSLKGSTAVQSSIP